MIHATVVSNGIQGLERSFRSNATVQYTFVETGAHFDLDLAGTDLLIVPNGSDHVAMLKVKTSVRAFLDTGGMLFCFDGWFTDWVPANQWVHSNEKKTRDIRYFVGEDRYGLFEDVELDHLQFNHGISGWWACGYIEAAAGAEVVLHDTWNRPMIVLDETSTNGLMILTASGPLGDAGIDVSEAPDATPNGLTTLYRNLIRLAANRHVKTAHASH